MSVMQMETDTQEAFNAGRNAGRKEVLSDFTRIVDAIREDVSSTWLQQQVLDLFTHAELMLRRKYGGLS